MPTTFQYTWVSRDPNWASMDPLWIDFTSVTTGETPGGPARGGYLVPEPRKMRRVDDDVLLVIGAL